MRAPVLLDAARVRACAGLLDVSQTYGFAPLSIFCTPGAVRGAASSNISVIQWWRDLANEGQNAAKAAALVGEAARFLGIARNATPTQQSSTVVKALKKLGEIRAKLDVLKTQINKRDARGRTIITPSEFSRMSRDWHVQMSVIAKGIEVPQQQGAASFGVAPAVIVGIAASVAVMTVAICYVLNQRELVRQEEVLNRRIEMIPEPERAQVIQATAQATGENPLAAAKGGGPPAGELAELLKGATGLLIAGAAIYVGVAYVLPATKKILEAQKA